MTKRRAILGLTVLSALALKAATGEYQLLMEQLDTSRATCGKQSIRLNRSVSGNLIFIGGRRYWRGIGTHAPSRIEIPLGGGALRFTAGIGPDDAGKNGSVQFKIWADDRLAYDSGVMRTGTHREINVDLRGAQKMVLEVTDAGDGSEGDYAAFGEAKVFFAQGKFPPNDVRAHSRQLGILTPPESARPRINGAAVFGVRPGHPLLYRVPVTGEKPLEVSVEGLAQGLAFDPTTRMLTGALPTCGDYPVVIRARNAKGAATRKLTIRVGETIALTPPMGWNSWNAFKHDVTQEIVQRQADAMVASGLADHGYAYVCTDDFWAMRPTKDKRARAADGRICVTPKFPSMKGLADYIHAKGLKAGIYSSPGPTTCGGCEGSFRHEVIDARTFAEWGFDFLKHDWCSYGGANSYGGKGLINRMYPYLLMGDALRAQNRDIILSLCQYGMENVSSWGASVGGQSWRTTGDVYDTWPSVAGSIERQKPLFYWSRPGSWNDPDMLVVGHISLFGYNPCRLAPNEQYTHLSLWALTAAPLMLGCDLTKLDAFTRALVTNDEVIEIDQDERGAAAACVASGKDWEVWARPLADGSIAAGLYNKSLEEQVVPLEMEKLGLLGSWRVRDVWRQRDEGNFAKDYRMSVPGHATHLIRLSPTDTARFREGQADIRAAAWSREF